MNVQHINVVDGGELPLLLSPGPFKAVLLSEGKVHAGWREKVCDWLITNTCLYFMAWGEECEQWHDCVDTSLATKFAGCPIPDEQFVMTTWHSDESLGDLAFFAKNCAYHDVPLNALVVISVGAPQKAIEFLQLLRAKRLES